MSRRVLLMLPQCVGSDIEKWHRKHNLPRLDGLWPAAGAQTCGPIFYPVSRTAISIKDSEFASGCLVMSGNHSRAVHRNGALFARPSGLALTLVGTIPPASASAFTPTPKTHR
ncbi:hypothetical protein BKA70DRAFT_1271561 [Coprinopsis sp. MPI-PUGE-AT-0042]|nr:hypothetical protein BKA70DRAFT_1271561 [Coprinopsis sp. MPI-PUGE-AT-0042]